MIVLIVRESLRRPIKPGHQRHFEVPAPDSISLVLCKVNFFVEQLRKDNTLTSLDLSMSSDFE